LFSLERSWQAYVDDQLVGTGKIAAAAIIGHDGSIWAKSPGFYVTYRLILFFSYYSSIFSFFRPDEGQAIVTLFRNNPSKVFSSGVTVNGIKYMGIKVTFS
jgi:profilin